MTIPASVWNNVSNAAPYGFVAAETYYYEDGFLTGPYYSQPYPISFS